MNIQFFVLSGMLLLDKILTEDGRFSKEGKGEEEVDKWERGGRRGEGRQERGGEEAGEGRRQEMGGRGGGGRRGEGEAGEGRGRKERGGGGRRGEEEAGEGRQEREGGGREAGIGRCRRVGKQWGG